MDDGKIVESGTHEELLKAQGLYARLSELQAISSRASAGDDFGGQRARLEKPESSRHAQRQ